MEALLQNLTYDFIYMNLWEAAQRYHQFTAFRVIGNSHDKRMIPMLEIGTGKQTVFCIAGFTGTDRLTPMYLLQMAKEYCRYYEQKWEMAELYTVYDLLNRTRLCIIPLVNPDGYEICGKGYPAIRNPVFRQMLRMKNIPHSEFSYNARGIDLRNNFRIRKYEHNLPIENQKENETKALIHIWEEYPSIGLLSFFQHENKIIYYKHPQSIRYNQRSYRLARSLQKCSHYHLEKHTESMDTSKTLYSPERYFMKIFQKTAIKIEFPIVQIKNQPQQIQRKQEYLEICSFPLEFISLT